MGKLYASKNGVTTSNIKPYVDVNGVTKAAKKIYYGYNNQAVLVYAKAEASYLSRFTIPSTATSFDIVLED